MENVSGNGEKVTMGEGSNHPHAIIKQLPGMIAKWLSALSSSGEILKLGSGPWAAADTRNNCVTRDLWHTKRKRSESEDGT